MVGSRRVVDLGLLVVNDILDHRSSLYAGICRGTHRDVESSRVVVPYDHSHHRGDGEVESESELYHARSPVESATVSVVLYQQY